MNFLNIFFPPWCHCP